MKLTSYYQRICERSKEREDTSPYVLPISQNLLWNLSWLSDTQHQDPKWEWQARDNLEINPITIKPEAASHTAEQFCWIPLPCCSQSRHPFPIKSLALLVCVSPQTIYELYTRDNSQALKGVPLPVTKRWTQRSICSFDSAPWFQHVGFFFPPHHHAIDKRNAHILRYEEVMLAYTWVNLNFMLTGTTCLWPIKHTLYICFNY